MFLLYSHSFKFVMAPIVPMNYMFAINFISYNIIDKEANTNNYLPRKAIAMSLSSPLPCKYLITSSVVHLTTKP